MVNYGNDTPAQQSPPQGEIALVVEEVAPWENITQTNRRVSKYLKAGVRLVWLINYHERLVTIFPRDNNLQIAEENDELTDCVSSGFRYRAGEFFDSAITAEK